MRRSPALSVDDLAISVRRGEEWALAVDGVSFAVEPGGVLGIVGESGSGKSLTLRALMGLLPATARIDAGRVQLHDEPLPLAGRAARPARRGRLTMVFQDPLSALDPVQTAGSQIAEVPRRVLGLSRRESWRRAVELLALVGIPGPDERAKAYPHQLSGGMRQRVAIAMALASEPDVLLCDEPTTALDVTVQAQVLDLLDQLRSRLGLAIVFVSHDLAVVGELCDQVCVMYAGRLVETGGTPEVLRNPTHPYTRGLRGAAVDLDEPDRPPVPIPGSLPEPGRLPAGCAFEPRCPLAGSDCRSARPEMRLLGPAAARRAVACFHPQPVPVAA
jgi:oligopeptide/dipeptide ABC transporter ATP-binding protein